MAAVKAATEIEQVSQWTEEYESERTYYDHDRLAILYGRQSTVKQHVQNIYSSIDQSEGLRDRAKRKGWSSDSQQVLMIENDVAKRNQISGTLKIDSRPGLKIVCEYIDKGEAGAVFAVDISRLFRDETGIQPATFAEKCRKARCIVVTDDYTYDFVARPGDVRRFINDALEAAAEGRRIKKRLHRNRERKAQSGKLANGVAPIGLMVDYQPDAHGKLKGDNLKPSPHAPQVAALYRRFKELGADENALLREIIARAQRGMPLFPAVPGIIEPKTIKLLPMYRSKADPNVTYSPRNRTRKPDSPDDILLGWTIKARKGLLDLLANPAYRGYLVWKGTITNRDNPFPAIVPEDDWTYAYYHNPTVKYTLDGLPIARETKPVTYTCGKMAGKTIERTTNVARYDQENSLPKNALFAGKRDNGKPVIDGVNGTHVYISPVASHLLYYEIRTFRGIRKPSGFDTSISVKELDSIFERHLRTTLLTLGLAKKVHNGNEHHVTVGCVPLAKAQQLEQIAIDTNTPKQLQPANDTDELTVIRRELKQIQDDLDIAGAVMDPDVRKKKYARQAFLLQRQREEEQRIKDAEINKAKMEQARRDVEYAYELWDKWDLERRQTFIRLVTDSVTLEEISTGWLRLTIQWNAVLGGCVESCYIWRSGGSEWSEYEIETLRAAYPSASLKTLLYLLPNRALWAIRGKARRLGLSRTNQRNDSPLPVRVSVNDMAVVQKYGLKMTHSAIACTDNASKELWFLREPYDESEKPGLGRVQWVKSQERNDGTSL